MLLAKEEVQILTRVHVQLCVYNNNWGFSFCFSCTLSSPTYLTSNLVIAHIVTYLQTGILNV